MAEHTYNNIESSRKEYESLPDVEWRKDYFDEATGGYVATHFLKTPDDMSIPGIVAEVRACHTLSHMGKHILRLPENIPELIDLIYIIGKPYRELLKYKPNEDTPRGYPDAYFDGQTWDFKTSSFTNDDTLRHRLKDGRKADNVIFIPEHSEKAHQTNINTIRSAIGREYGSRLPDGTWAELPDVYYLLPEQLIPVWEK